MQTCKYDQNFIDVALRKRSANVSIYMQNSIKAKQRGRTVGQGKGLMIKNVKMEVPSNII